MIEGTVEQIVKVTAPKISIFYRIILVIACLLAATTIVQTGWLGVIALSIQDDVINTIFESTACSVTSEFSDGDVVGVTLDTSGSYAIHDFYVNNSLVRTRSLSAGSESQTYFPCVGDQWSNTAGSTFVFTGRFKSADMTYSPPSGFTAWDD